MEEERDMTEGIGATSEPVEAMRRFAEDILRGRGSLPEDVAGTVGVLLSPASDDMTGQCLRTDGGMILQ